MVITYIEDDIRCNLQENINKNFLQETDEETL